MDEAGFPQMQSGAWFGLLAPAGTPAAAIAWVNGETRKAFAVEQVHQRYLSQGTLLPLGSPQEFAAHIASERLKWGEVIRHAHIRLE
jgi:tripartite-type tricarboxylate transporter receptor subunit TctC